MLLSVSPKRIDGLQPMMQRRSRCESEPLSVSPKRIDGLQPIDRSDVQPLIPEAFSIPKADRWAAALRPRVGRHRRRQLFQYPQSGSMGCSERLEDEPVPLRVAFQYPQSGSMGCSRQRCGRSRCSSQRTFQYPQSGSMGCSQNEFCGELMSMDHLSVSPKRIDGLQRENVRAEC